MLDALARRGVGFGDRVLILALNYPEYIEAVFGITALGAIAVPVNFRLTPPEVAYIVGDSGAKAIVTGAPYMHELLVMPCRNMGPQDADFASILAMRCSLRVVWRPPFSSGSFLMRMFR